MLESFRDLCRLLHTVVTDPDESLDYKFGFGGVIVAIMIAVGVMTIAVAALFAYAVAYLVVPSGGL